MTEVACGLVSCVVLWVCLLHAQHAASLVADLCIGIVGTAAGHVSSALLLDLKCVVAGTAAVRSMVTYLSLIGGHAPHGNEWWPGSLGDARDGRAKIETSSVISTGVEQVLIVAPACS